MRFEFYKPHKLQEVIDWVNEMRAKLNIGPPIDDLPKGYANSRATCPVARALKVYGQPVSVGGDRAQIGSSSLVLPGPVRRFVTDFDRGHYPEYRA